MIELIIIQLQFNALYYKLNFKQFFQKRTCNFCIIPMYYMLNY